MQRKLKNVKPNHKYDNPSSLQQTMSSLMSRLKKNLNTAHVIRLLYAYNIPDTLINKSNTLLELDNKSITITYTNKGYS